MLIIMSDLHLADGSCAQPVSTSAFRLFADRVEEMAFNASWRSNGRYRPVESIEIIMLGDVLETLHSTLWLDKEEGEPGYVRPWTKSKAPEFAAKVQEITRAILRNNAPGIRIMKELTQTGLRMRPANRRDEPAAYALKQVPVPVRLYYMVGNHDWYYHLPGPAFDAIRQEIITAFGLANDPGPFPHEARESDRLLALLDQYEIYAQHGDLYDTFNYCKAKGRNAASLADALGVEVFNKYPVEVERRMDGEIPAAIIDSLRELVNVRPILAVPLWISGHLRQNNVGKVQQKKLKAIWDELCDNFLKLPLVREADRRFKFDIVDAMEVAIKLTDAFSFKTLDDIVVWARKKIGDDISFSHFALQEEAFLKRKARFIVYGHTHHHEIVSLDTLPAVSPLTSQLYLNSGTWHTYYDLAVYKPKEQKFIPYQVLTYLCFYKDDERGGRHFETWSGAYSD
ncbi:MAG: hypothetical protein JXB85_02630 [Anaerolineales bacterium]|nr:hypothetical protein [Anaerolineales bacterium]